MIISSTDECSCNSTVLNSSNQGFNAKLQAQINREVQEEIFDKDFSDIEEKGFHAWAMDVSLNRMKEVLRRQLEEDPQILNSIMAR